MKIKTSLSKSKTLKIKKKVSKKMKTTLLIITKRIKIKLALIKRKNLKTKKKISKKLI